MLHKRTMSSKNRRRVKRPLNSKKTMISSGQKKRKKIRKRKMKRTSLRKNKKRLSKHLMHDKTCSRRRRSRKSRPKSRKIKRNSIKRGRNSYASKRKKPN